MGRCLVPIIPISIPQATFLQTPKSHLHLCTTDETQNYRNLKRGANKLIMNHWTLWHLWNLFSLAEVMFPSEMGKPFRRSCLYNGCKRAQRLHVILCNREEWVIASSTLWPCSSLKWLSKQQQVPGEELPNGFLWSIVSGVLTITAGRHGNAISSVSLWTFCDSHTNISFIKLMYCGSDSWLLIKYNLLWNKWVKSDEHKLVWAITSGLSSLLSLDVAVFKNKQDWQSLLKAGMTY